MSRKPFVLAGILATVAVLAAGIVLTSRVPGSGTRGDTPETPRERTFDQMLQDGTSAIYVEDQAAGAAGVAVGFAVMREPGFVVVFDDDGGVPGNAIGVSELLPPGGGEHVPVTLGAPLSDGEIYYAVLYRDDGDGRFDAAVDAQLTDAQDDVVLMTFAALTDAMPEEGAVLP